MFRAAIQQSGTAMNTWAFTENAREIAFAMASTLEPLFHSNRSEDVLEVLQNAETYDILIAAKRLKVRFRTCIFLIILMRVSL